MRSASYISSTLKKRRRGRIINKFYVFFLVALILGSVLSILTWVDYFKIKEIQISGASNIKNEKIIESVQELLNNRFAFVFSMSNLLFMPRASIKNLLYEKYKVIENVKIGFVGKNSILIELKERSPKALWCKSDYPDSKECFFMDKMGFVYLESPNITANTLVRYYGYIEDENPTGKYFLNNESFKKIYSFNGSLNKMGFTVVAFSVKSLKEYESILNGDAVVVVDDKIDLNIALESLESILREGIIKTDIEFLQKISHLDLRYGNKVHLDYKD